MTFILVLSFSLLSCNFNKSGHSEKNQVPRIVEMHTDYGDMKIRLYDQTPVHRDNFIKLTEKGYFNGTLFHRVIDGFMIQGGDPDSKGAAAGVRLGEGGPGYQLPSEFRSDLFHKKGVIAAAREGDAVNPEKKSAGSQFYIAQGKIYRPGELDSLVIKVNGKRRSGLLSIYHKKYRRKLATLQQKGDMVQVSEVVDNIQHSVDSLMKKEKLVLSPAQIKAYTTVGGIPHLDGNYTVFGEVIEGMDVIDKIAKAEIDGFSRPLKNIEMTVKIVQ